MPRFEIVPARSRVWIDASSSVHPIRTHTDGLTGWIELRLGRGGHPDLRSTGRAHLELPVDALRSGNPLEDRELRRRIDARRFPTIEGDLTSISPTDERGRYRVTGDLTFRGVTRPHTDEMTIGLDAGDGTLRLAGASRFDVRDFGMQPPRILTLRVHPEVDVRVEIVAAPAD